MIEVTNEKIGIDRKEKRRHKIKDSSSKIVDRKNRDSSQEMNNNGRDRLKTPTPDI